MSFLIIIFFPLFGSLLSGFYSSFLGFQNSIRITILNIFFTFLLAISLLYLSISQQSQFYIQLFSWISSGFFECYWGFMFDSLTNIMLCIVTFISLLVHIYSSEYLLEDPHLPRFMSYLSLFTFFMIILVTADNFIQMFVGWEGVGFCSYLLINFWFTRLQANKAAIKAMLVNRVSDFTLVLGLLILLTNLKSLEYASIFNSILLIKSNYTLFFNIPIFTVDLICILLTLGAMGKSAQIFLHVWLPDAMEGPTPVSALIHAATMVTACVFLITRCSPIFEYSCFSLDFITVIGAMTAFFACSVGLTQNDLKKVIAYSTCSQLGYMMFICGLSNYSLGIFHLSNHAFFKALLFLGAGAVIHALSDEQDMRKMGGLKKILPFTYSMSLIGSLALMGFPFLTGFYSKDAILEVAYASYTNFSHFAYWLGTISAFFTSFYSIRLLYLTFLTKTNSYKSVIIHAHDPAFYMSLPLFFLAFGSIFIGYLTSDLFIGLGTPFWNNSVFILPNHIQRIDSEFLITIIKLLPVIFSFIGFFLSIYLYHFAVHSFFQFKISLLGAYLYNFLNRKWYFDKIYNEYLIQNILKISYNFTYKIIDKGVIEFLGPLGIVNIIYNLSKYITRLQTGFFYHYSFFFISGCLFLFFIFFNNIFL